MRIRYGIHWRYCSAYTTTQPPGSVSRAKEQQQQKHACGGFWGGACLYYTLSDDDAFVSTFKTLAQGDSRRHDYESRNTQRPRVKRLKQQRTRAYKQTSEMQRCCCYSCRARARARALKHKHFALCLTYAVFTLAGAHVVSLRNPSHKQVTSIIDTI